MDTQRYFFVDKVHIVLLLCGYISLEGGIMSTNNLLGIAEIAKINRCFQSKLLVTGACGMTTFRARFKGFKAGRYGNAKRWKLGSRAFRGAETHVLSLINLKGGVAKDHHCSGYGRDACTGDLSMSF